jgi:hypothetical protein
MLTALDQELFSDDVEVVEIPPHDLYIYLIQKNGSTSLKTDAQKKNWRILKNHALRSLDRIDVYLRNPRDRYLSGVNTFVQHLLRDNVELDKKTCKFFATHYHFLNRHYLPQWHWLVNMARFISPNCKIRLHPLRDLHSVTDLRMRTGIVPLTEEEVVSWLPDHSKLEFWFLLDNILLGRCGQELTWGEILQIYHDHPAKLLNIIMDRTQQIQNVLS